jgi:hypothetical protein
MHPAAALHRPEFRAAITEDFKAIPAILNQVRRTATPVTREVPEEMPPPEQLALF